MSDVLSSNDLRILGLVLPQGHLDRLKNIGLNIEDKSLGELTKKKVADALKVIGQAHLAKVLSDKEGKMKLIMLGIKTRIIKTYFHSITSLHVVVIP